MLWFWFIIGLILLISGAFSYAYNHYITIGNLSFDGEKLGICLMPIGGILAGIMCIALAIKWGCSF